MSAMPEVNRSDFTPDYTLLAALPPGAVVRLGGFITRAQVEDSDEEATAWYGYGVLAAIGMELPYDEDVLAVVVRQIYCEWRRLAEPGWIDSEFGAEFQDKLLTRTFGSQAPKVRAIFGAWEVS